MEQVKQKAMYQVLILLGAVWMLVPTASKACTCGNVTPEEAFSRSDLVFEGTVTATSEPYQVDFPHILQVVDVYDAEVAVMRAWKGQPGSMRTVFTTTSGASCGVYFQVGRTYLVYAYRMEGVPVPYVTNICIRTARVEHAEEDLRYLGEGYPVATEEPTATLPLRLAQNRPNPFRGVTQITYTLPEARTVTRRVVDLLGRQVVPVYTARHKAGTHHEQLDLQGQPAGIYVYEIRAGNQVARRRMVLVR